MTCGSPPLTRGPHTTVIAMQPVEGITPAYAGTTHRPRTISCRVWDHPRLRGDHWFIPCEFNHIIGSPPLTRGPPRTCRGPSPA